MTLFKIFDRFVWYHIFICKSYISWLKCFGKFEKFQRFEEFSENGCGDEDHDDDDDKLILRDGWPVLQI